MERDPNEPYFLLNEFLETDKRYLDHITETINQKQPRWQEQAVFLRNFTNNLYRAYRKTRPHFAEIALRKQHEHALLLKKQQTLLLQKKEALLQRIQHLQPQPIPQIQSAPLPVVEQPKPQFRQAKVLLLPLLNDTTVREIICTGAEQPLHIARNGNEQSTSIQFTDDELNTFLKNTAETLHQTITEENPFLNAQLDQNTIIQGNITTPYLKAKFAIIKN